MKNKYMEIAPGITCEYWNNLDLSSACNRDWCKAINVLKSRIIERYISPVDLMIEHEELKPYKERRFGFTILAIDCLLIETLQAFQDGNEDTKWRKGKTVFENYLTKSSNLGMHFTTKLAGEFYDSYRNGILHQGQIKKNHLVWSIGEIVHTVEGAMVINRTKFHKCLKKDFEIYIRDLNDVANTELRNNFKSKMDTLCK